MAKTPAVPYCTVKGFRTCIDILRRDRPELIDREVLVAKGLSQHSVYPVLGALRFLGIVDGDGRLTTDSACFLGDDVSGRRRVVERAYGDILRDVQLPVDDREVVDRLLIDRHEVAPGVAAFCSTFFLWMAAEAGLPVADAGRQRRGRPPAHLSQLSDAARNLLLANATAARLAAGPSHDGLDPAFVTSDELEMGTPGPRSTEEIARRTQALPR